MISSEILAACAASISELFYIKWNWTNILLQ